MEERISRTGTGIKGLDDIIGGYPQGRSILVTGDPGSGKTIMALQFAIQSARSGLKTIYITTEEDETDLRIQCASLGWDITAMIILDSATSGEFNDIALYSVYGAIRLIKRENPYTGRRERVMDIIKMRSTRTPIEFIPYIISDSGIEVIENPEE